VRLGGNSVRATLAGAAVLLGVASTPAAAAVPKCTAAHLKPWAGGQTGTAGGNIAEFGFVNKGVRVCSLKGFPKLQMLDAAGQPIATTDTPNKGAGAPDYPPKLVVLPPRKRAYFLVNYPVFTGTGSTSCPTATKLALTPPGSSSALVLGGSGAAIQPFAGNDTSLGCGLVYVSAVSAKPGL
jgi:Domain of unknown function (DUF4232)